MELRLLDPRPPVRVELGRALGHDRSFERREVVANCPATAGDRTRSPPETVMTPPLIAQKR